MKITKLLVRLGLLQAGAAATTPQAPVQPPPATRVVTLKELMKDIDRETSLLDDPSAWRLDEHDAYGHQPLPNGWTSLKVMGLVRGLAPETARELVGEQLAKDDVTVEAILEDATRRDQALDAHHAHLEDQLKRLEAEAEKRKAALRADIDQKQRELAALEDTVDSTRARVVDWVSRKRTLEDELEAAMKILAEGLKKS